MIVAHRRILCIAVGAVLIAATAHAEKIRTAIPGANLNYLSVYSADERKLFRDEGLENETIAIGGPAGIAALVSGDVDFSGAGGSGLRGAVRGAPLKAIFYQTEKPTWYLVVHPTITQAADLKGKKIGVALIGDSEDRFITLYAGRAGVSPKEITRISLGTSIGDKILGLKSGAVSAVVLDPAGTVAAEREGLRKLVFMGDIFTLPFQGYVATHQKLAENPAQVKRWIRAMTRSLLFIRERPEDAADIALRRLRIRNITKPMLVEAIRSYTRAFPPGVPGVPSAEGVKSILENELRIPLKLDKPLAAENFFDLRWAEEVRKEFESK
ncbi:MAG TPA: ABC transporter substrate-binding protein [Candidatus Binatia bacterium]|nr:ABC transporter substrate-binding protein [Candidatus Binatia bacterium]